MIKYALICDQGHTFESWFSNAQGYETQVKRGFVECPTCQTKQVSKAMMAPSVSTSRRKEVIRAQTAAMTAAAMQAQAQSAAAAPAAAPAPEPAQPVALLDEGQQALRAMVRELHEKMTENSTDVGDRFTTEARDMQSGDAPTRPIHGRATLEEARSLIEDGVPIMPLPTLPDEWN